MYESFEANDKIYIVVEYMKGGDLCKYIKSTSPLSESTTVHLIQQIASAISYLHQCGIIHRDLKLENILLESTELPLTVKISDFGLSDHLLPSQESSEMKGTLYYLAPEIILNKPVDHAVDVWSLGVLAYILLSGNYPFYDVVHSECIKYCLKQENHE